ncbi:MAG TPA: phosphoribosyltransferase family protein [Vicinamibacterales bacterium]|nr:phosphoribosyltransferase family protein [Vicinamibacterales bacterium]
MNYRSVADLNDQVVRWLPQLPRDLDIIVGIPRSGLLVANLLALHLNLPMTDVEGLVEGRVTQAGGRYRHFDARTFLSVRRKVLVVDDSVLDGTEMTRVKERLKAVSALHDLHYAATYVAPGAEKHVDCFAELLPPPRCFEWNLMHHKLFLENSCMDIDGVLCCDPTDEENDDGVKYEAFIRDAKPLYLPTHPVGNLVTCRLEKYRAGTEDWLARHGVKYGKLFMMDYPDMSARRAENSHGAFKAGIFLKTKSWLFIESCLPQAREIAELTGYDVFCMETREMMAPGAASARRRRILDAPRNFRYRVAAGFNFAMRVPGGVKRRIQRLIRS